MLSLGYAAILYANTVQGVSIYDPLLHPTPPPSRVCCANLEEPTALMKMGLSMVLVGHVNFLLGALVHGVVLRHINLHKQARAMEYAISNVVALTSGLVGIVIGILAIVLSKNKKSRALTWSLFSISLISSLMASASAIGLLVSVVRAIIHGGRSLLTHCRFPDAVGYSSVTNECPFDPTRIYASSRQSGKEYTLHGRLCGKLKKPAAVHRGRFLLVLETEAGKDQRNSSHLLSHAASFNTLKARL
nr:transmembrane protein 54b isoform X4 [Syngnathus scovelli]